MLTRKKLLLGITAGVFAVIVAISMFVTPKVSKPIVIERHPVLAQETGEVAWLATNRNYAVIGVIEKRLPSRVILAPWDKNESIVYTDYLLRVEEVWFSEPGTIAAGDLITLRVPEGQTPDVVVSDGNSPKLTPGEKILTFLMSDVEDRTLHGSGTGYYVPTLYGTFHIDNTGVARRPVEAPLENQVTVNKLKDTVAKVRQ